MASRPTEKSTGTGDALLQPGVIGVIGLGPGGLDGLEGRARRLLDRAAVLVGGARHLAMIPESHPAERLPWRQPLSDTLADIAAHRQRGVCVLASGDPMSYGIGVTLLREFGHEALEIIPAVGALALAAARLGWPLEGVQRLTLHGRPASLLHPHIGPGARLLILAHDGGTAAMVATLLCARGHGGSSIHVLENMGMAGENLRQGRADGADGTDWQGMGIAGLNTLGVMCDDGVGAPLLPVIAGLADGMFQHDGQLTKREVRAASLAALAPAPGALLWDLGAGAGSVAIEWMRAGGRAVAVEREAARCELIARNAEALGVPGLQIVHGCLPDELDHLIAAGEAPQAIFLGGGLGLPGLCEACCAALADGGRFVANAVTLEGEAQLATLFRAQGGEMSRIAVSRLAAVGGFHGWRPLMPVSQYRWRKGGDGDGNGNGP